MSDRISPESSPFRGTTFWTILIFAPAFAGAACVSTPEPQVSTEDIDSVEHRIENVERTNGRLTVRVEEMERQMALVQDRVESNRIALQRQGYLGRRGDRFARAPDQARGQERPQPAPESNYRQRDSDYRADPSMDQRMDQRGMRRIPLSDQQSGRRDASERSDGRRAQEVDAPADGHLDYEPDAPDSGSASEEQAEIVITNESLERRYGPSTSSSDSSSTDSTDDQPAAHVPVTSERLPTTDELDYAPQQQDSDEDQQSAEEQGAGDENDAGRWAQASNDELLDLYQDSLAEYRAGDYAQALEGFEHFLAAGPTDGYVDNALYWIGECHYGLGEYDRSVDYFQRILDELPSGNKVPDAMLKMSLAYDRLGEPQQAIELLEELTDRYPNSNPGRLGEEQLEEYARDGGD